jgi:energy-coupling factor transport system permease protein
LWAGTKLIALLLQVVVVLLFPGWPAALTGLAVVSLAAGTARVPLSAVPRLPVWFWIFLLGGALLSFLGGGIMLYLESILITLVLVAASAIVNWTTPVAEISPAVGVLGSPLRRLGLPADEWALTMALCVRTLPLLIDEFRILLAARRLRPRPLRPQGIRPIVQFLKAELVDLLTSVLAVAIRRAAELGRAITARGGIPEPSVGRPILRPADAVALLCVAAACALVIGLTP